MCLYLVEVQEIGAGHRATAAARRRIFQGDARSSEDLPSGAPQLLQVFKGHVKTVWEPVFWQARRSGETLVATVDTTDTRTRVICY